MTTLAFVSAFRPARNSLNEYGFHMAKAFARRQDIDKIIILADKGEELGPELNIDPKIEVRRVWDFNKVTAARDIQKTLKDICPDFALLRKIVAYAAIQLSIHLPIQSIPPIHKARNLQRQRCI